MDERFSIIRAAEYEILKGLSATACKALIALKFGQSDGARISFGVRDLEEFGIKKSAAADALNELLKAGLIAVERESSFGVKRQKRIWRVLHVRTEKDALQSAQPDTGKQNSPPQRTIGRTTVRPAGQVIDLQSARADTPRRLPSTSSQEVEGEGSRHYAGNSAALRDRQNAIAKAAKSLNMTESAFWDQAGGPSKAGDLAWRWERGEINTSQLKTALADSSAEAFERVREATVCFSTSTAGGR